MRSRQEHRKCCHNFGLTNRVYTECGLGSRENLAFPKNPVPVGAKWLSIYLKYSEETWCFYYRDWMIGIIQTTNY
jgi:hypothetical protein